MTKLNYWPSWVSLLTGMYNAIILHYLKQIFLKNPPIKCNPKQIAECLQQIVFNGHEFPCKNIANKSIQGSKLVAVNLNGHEVLQIKSQ